MEQLAARRAHNPKVAGSSPAPATKIYPLELILHIKWRNNNMYGDWMKKISLDVTEDDLKKYEEDKKND